MIHWDWLATGFVGVGGLLALAVTLDWLSDKWDEVQNRRAIERQAKEDRRRSDAIYAPRMRPGK